MDKKYYKQVLLPIQVCQGDFCVGGPLNRICTHFDNEGGHPTCDLNIDWQGFGTGLKYDKESRVPKPEFCKNLIEPYLLNKEM